MQIADSCAHSDLMKRREPKSAFTSFWSVRDTVVSFVVNSTRSGKIWRCMQGLRGTRMAQVTLVTAVTATVITVRVGPSRVQVVGLMARGRLIPSTVSQLPMVSCMVSLVITEANTVTTAQPHLLSASQALAHTAKLGVAKVPQATPGGPQIGLLHPSGMGKHPRDLLE